MNPRQDSPLGPQCLRCRRRRVKCDSAPETCYRCGKDGYDCPGYEKKTKWKVFTPEGMQKSRGHPRPSRQSSLDTSTTTCSSSTEQGSPRSGSSPEKEKSDLYGMDALPSSLILSRVEKEIIEIQSAIIYCAQPGKLVVRNYTDRNSDNDTLVKDIASNPVPGETIVIPLDKLLQSPKMLQHIIVTIVTCHRLAKSGSINAFFAEKRGENEAALMDSLNRHRGRGLTQIQRHLQCENQGIVPGWERVERRKKGMITLVSVIMLLAQEIQMSATRLWIIHLNAAKSVVKPMGGVPTLWVEVPALRGLYTLLLMIDILSCTTSPVRAINLAEQVAYLESVPNLEEMQRRLLASFMPCPLPVLTAILQTNVLRASLYRGATVPAPSSESSELQQFTFAQTFNSTLASLLRFDPKAWAQQVCNDYLSHPQPRPKVDNLMLAWEALASAFQSAAIIYLLRSVQSEHLPTTLVPKAVNAACLLQEQRRRIDASVTVLFKDLAAGMKPTSLWRFASWPLFIYSYELVGWSEPEIVGDLNSPPGTIDGAAGTPPPNKETVAAIRRMQRLGKRLGANCVFDAVELLQGVWEGRHRSGPEQAEMNWDDGFGGWCVFLV